MDLLSKTTQSGKSSTQSRKRSAQSGRGKNKRYWKREEEKVLVHGLVELSRDPKWKSEGNFKNGYMNQLEFMLNDKFPNCGLKTVSHIESKIKWFKKKYNILNEMLHTSGFGSDNANKTLKCEKSVYEKFCKFNSKAQGLWRVPFSFLNYLDLGFGPDRATGDAIEDFLNAVKNMENEGINIIEEGEDDNEVAEEDLLPPPPTKVRNGKPSKNREKRKMGEVMDLATSNDITSEFLSYMKEVSATMSTMASVMSVTQQHEQAIMLREQELIDQKKNLTKEVIKIPSLSRYEAVMGARMLRSMEEGTCS